MRLVLLAAAAALAPLLAAAEEPSAPAEAGRAYAFAAFGPAFALDHDTKLAGFDHGDALEVGGGFRLAPHVAIELGSGYLRFADAQAYQLRAGSDPSAPTEQLSFERTLSAMPLLATVRAFARWGFLELHARGGAGAYRAALYGTVTSSLSPAWSFDEAAWSFGVHAGASVLATIAEDVTLGVDARWVKTTATFRPDRATAPTTAPPAPNVEYRLDSLVVSVAAGYRF